MFEKVEVVVVVGGGGGGGGGSGYTFSPVPFTKKLKNDKLLHETEERFLYIWLHKHITLY